MAMGPHQTIDRTKATLAILVQRAMEEEEEEEVVAILVILATTIHLIQAEVNSYLTVKGCEKP